MLRRGRWLSITRTTRFAILTQYVPKARARDPLDEYNLGHPLCAERGFFALLATFLRGDFLGGGPKTLVIQCWI